jgi:hypothetical protein
VTHKRLKLVGIVLLALMVLYAAAGFLLAPWLLQRHFPRFVEQKLERQVSVDLIRINPFLLHLEVRDFAVEGRHGRPALSVGRLFADLGFIGLLRRTWTMDELRLEDVQAHVVLERDGSLNLGNLARRLAGEDAEPGRPAALIVNQLAVQDASVVFTDLTGARPASTVIERVNVQAAGLSTRDDELASHALTAGLPDGGALEWRGELGLYPSVVASGEVRVRGLAAQTVWPFLRDDLLLSEFEGKASVSSRYAYDSEQSLRLEGMTLDLAEVLLARQDEQQPMLAMKKIAVAGGSLDLAKRAVAIETIAFQSGQVAVSFASDGKANWAGVLAPERATTDMAESPRRVPTDGADPAARSAAQAAAGPDWQFEVAKLRVDQVGLRYVDRSRERPLSLGVSNATAEVRLAISAGTPTRVLADAIDARLRNLVLGAPGDEDAAATLHSVQIEEGRFDLQGKLVAAQRLNVEGGQTSIVRQQQGEIALVELLGLAPDDASRNAETWAFHIAALEVSAVDVALADRTFKPAVAYDLQVQSITATNLASSSQAPTPFDAIVRVRQGGTIRASGSLAEAGSSLQAKVELQELETAPLRPVLERSSGLTVSAGPVSLSADVRYEAAKEGRPRLTLGDVAATLPNLVLRRPGFEEPLLSLQRLEAHGGSLNLANRSLGAREIVLTGGGARVVQSADGSIPLLQWLAEIDQPSAAARAGSSGNERAAWRHEIGLVRVDSFDLAFADRGFEPPLALGGTLQGSVKNVGNDTRASFDAALALNGGGMIRAEGTAAPAGPHVEARVEVSDVLLKPLQPLLQRYAALTVESGAVSASASVRFGGDAGALRADGTFRVADFLVNEAWSGDRFLAWKQLRADRVELDLASRRLIIREVTTQEPGAKIVISKERDVNLARVLKPDGDDRDAGEESPARQRENKAHDAMGEDPAGFEFRVERVRLRNGNVDFADLSLVLPFSTKVTEIDGTIVGISNDASRRADVKASGAIQPYGSARVEGSLVPSEPRRFTDLHVEFNNVQVPPLSPYTATFAGRKVESGKLWLDLEYKVKDSVLLGTNDIRLADFTLGERVEAPNAMNVPLNLAVALLTDADGQIRLSVPVRGDLDNPRFSVGSAIRQAVANALKRIVTAPFRALGRLLGGAAESVATIGFNAGSAALRPEQREKLDRLSHALAERPRLQLVVTAPYDPQTDRRALRRAQARRTLTQALGPKLEPGEDPGPIAFDDPSTRRALERLLEQHAGPGAMRELRAQVSGTTGSAERELYEAMFDRIAASQPLSESSTQVLATERARQIANYLRQQGVAPERVQTGRLAEVNIGADGAVGAQLGVASAGTAP